MLWRWQNSNCFRTCIGFPASCQSRGFVASLAIPTRCLSPLNAAEKNSLRGLWRSPSHVLRQAATAGPRSLVWRQTRLPLLPNSQGPVCQVWHGENRGVGVAGPQSVVYQAICLLRGPTLSSNPHQGSGRGTLPRLACRQGARQAVHARATPPRWQPCSAGDRRRRDRHCQGTPISDRGQRPGAWPCHLVRRPRSFGGQSGRVFHLAWTSKMQENSPGRNGHVAAIPHLHTQGRQRTTGQDLVRQVPVLTHLGEAMDKVRKREYARLSGADRRFIKGQRYTLLSRWGNLSTEGRAALKLLFKANRRLNKACLLKDSFAQLWDYRSPIWALRFFYQWRNALRWQRQDPVERVDQTVPHPIL